MDLVTLLLVLVVLGVILWGIGYVPWIDADIKKVIKVVAIVGVVLWIVFTVFHLQVPHIRIG